MRLLIILIIACIYSPAIGELKFVIELFRHGARGPLG